MRTLGRMSAFALHPEEEEAAARRHFLEFPTAPPPAAEAAARPLELHLEGVAARGASRGAGWRAVAKGASPALVARAAAAGEPLLGDAAGAAERRAARERAAAGWFARASEPHPVYGLSDPLSDDEAKALPVEELVAEEFARGPLDSGGAEGGSGGAWWRLAAAMPGRQLAAKIRARRLERAVSVRGGFWL